MNDIYHMDRNRTMAELARVQSGSTSGQEQVHEGYTDANGDMVGYHPLKEESQWHCCWDLVMGKNRKVDFAQCDMGADGKGPDEEPPDYVMPGR